MRIKRILAGMLAAVTIIAGSIPASGLQAEAATNWSVYSDDYFYNKMNASEKKLYSGMTSAANKAMESSDNITEIKAPYSGLTIEQLTNVLRIWTETEAQYFFISNSIHYSYSTGSGSVLSGTASIDVLREYQSGSARQAAKETFRNTIQSLLAQTTSASTLVEKEKIIHDALAKRLTWDGSDSQSKQSSASSLIGDTTVCAGYSAAFSVLMNALGAPTISITSSSHEWNEIYLGGKWYNVDVTYDDPLWNGGSNTYPDGRNIRYTCFNVSDSTLLADDYNAHIPDSYWDSYGRPVCSTDGGTSIGDSGSGRDISEIGKTDDTASNTDTGKSSDTVKKDMSSYKVTVSPKSVTLKKGARKGISYSTHSPSALTKVTWSSCNKKVAAVSGMVIRAKKKGRTTIKGTFRFADGTTKTVKISVRVK